MPVDLSEALNAGYLDDRYQQWKKDPASLSVEWQAFFKGFEIGRCGEGGSPEGGPAATLATAAAQLVCRYRELGHLLSCMDPLSACPIEHPLLTLDNFGLSGENMEQEVPTGGVLEEPVAPLKAVVERLRATYCRAIGVEYMHLQDPEERSWLRQRMEPTANLPTLSGAERRGVLEGLIASTEFEQFLNRKYTGVTRFSLEGGDVMIPLVRTLLRHAGRSGTKEMIIGMAHRGRLNIQTNVLGKPFDHIFSEFESCYDPAALVGSGDVKYHNGFMTDIDTGAGSGLKVFLADNPSHLEAVNPVVEGIARARLDPGGNPRAVVPLLIHGDAAFAGQGVVSETLNMSQLDGYRTGGTLHVIINNQIGYTTLPEDARSTRYSTDVAKMLMVPVFHVHGEDPEAAVHVAQLAVDYRNRYGKDVVIDLVCYRRYGHNEGDEPYFTQPRMYDRIRERADAATLYADRLIAEKVVSTETVATLRQKVRKELEASWDAIHGSTCSYPFGEYYRAWDRYNGRYSFKPVKTAVAVEQLLAAARILNGVPDGFELHPTLKRLLTKRREAVEKGRGLDWGNTEALAFATLLQDGYDIRLSGQDVRRGTFSHRHCVVYDRQDGRPYTPLERIDGKRGRFSVFNSHLAEYAVLGFEYGHSITLPDTLTIWEAQFGDFANTAQAVIDLFIAAGEAKWQRLSGLVMLLPHGWEGLGPEHSSARLERFLQLCAGDNMQVCVPTTPAQFFHLLRRQMLATYRKPLVVMSPKSLLRLPAAVSKLSDLSAGGFKTVLADAPPARAVRRVVFCSGKIAYQLMEKRKQLRTGDTAIVRLEQLYPFPAADLKRLIKRFGNCEHWLWTQEEPANMGAWQFVQPRLQELVGGPLRYAGRPSCASPATGFPRVYRAEQDAVAHEALKPL